ncbi:UMP kinase [Nanoarchaeota archaeon]
MKKTVVLSLGGSIIIPGDKPDHAFLKKFRELILSYVKKGYKFAIVCGGGGLSRRYVEAAKKIRKLDDEALDWLGISATHLNGFLLRVLFHEHSHHEVIHDYSKKPKISKKIVIGCGWKPGRSTDYDAIMIAKHLGAKTVINLSNIEYAYTKDPRKFKNAKKIKKTTWKEFRKITGNKWSPRLSLPFDPIASKLAQKNKTKVIIAKGTDLTNLKKILDEKEKIKGTIIE